MLYLIRYLYQSPRFQENHDYMCSIETGGNPVIALSSTWHPFDLQCITCT